MVAITLFLVFRQLVLKKNYGGNAVPSELSEFSSLDALCAAMRNRGVTTLVFKRLAPNDNSKNQIYLGSDYSALQLLPFGKVYADKSIKDSKRDRFKADLDFSWLDADGRLFEAPTTQLILYPKYPEVRMSGFLAKAQSRPSKYLASRLERRVLLIGVTDERKIIGHVIGPENPVFDELEQFVNDDSIFHTVFRQDRDANTKIQLLNALREIADLGWINSSKLSAAGEIMPYSAPNGGGYTLEALLGVSPNGINEPDFLGWEIKQHKATNLENPLSGGAITLMTPEPTGGVYKDHGVIEFVRSFGYPDKLGRPDRFNFGGVHRFGEMQAGTGLSLQLLGYDHLQQKISDIGGGIALVAEDGTIAALWHYETLLEKWNRKHAQAAYIPSANRQDGNIRQYRYGHVIALGTGTDFGKFLQAMALRSIYYDPGIKVEQASSDKPKSKRRSQFRIKPANLHSLYHHMEIVDLRL